MSKISKRFCLKVEDPSEIDDKYYEIVPQVHVEDGRVVLSMRDEGNFAAELWLDPKDAASWSDFGCR